MFPWTSWWFSRFFVEIASSFLLGRKRKAFFSPRCRRWFPPPRKSPALRDDWCTITPQTHPLVPTTARSSSSSSSSTTTTTTTTTTTRTRTTTTTRRTTTTTTTQLFQLIPRHKEGRRGPARPILCSVHARSFARMVAISRRWKKMADCSIALGFCSEFRTFLGSEFFSDLWANENCAIDRLIYIWLPQCCFFRCTHHMWCVCVFLWAVLFWSRERKKSEEESIDSNLIWFASTSQIEIFELKRPSWFW